MYSHDKRDSGTDRLCLLSQEMPDSSNKENDMETSSFGGSQKGSSWKAYLCGCATVLGVPTPPTSPSTSSCSAASMSLPVAQPGDTYPCGLSKDFWVDKNPVVVVRVPHKTLGPLKKAEATRHVGHAHALGRGHC